MKAINPYLFFNGNCAEAMKFYQKCLGGDLNVMKYEEGNCPVGMKDKVMHANLNMGSNVILASDSPQQDGGGRFAGISVCIQCSSADELEKLYAGLAQGGKTSHPPADTFWNARFGVLTDKFGVEWMFNYEKGGKTS